jgi:hypothetical protein
MSRPKIPLRAVVIGLLIFGAVILLFSFTGQFFYFFERVNEDEVAVQFQSGRITDIVGPGVYSDAGLFVDLKRVSSRAVAFEITDAELITKDKQRIGLVVTGDVFRPTLSQKDTIQELWAEYNQLYTDDEAVRTRISLRAQQAMKVCVGDRNFDDAVIGTARDELRNCIDDELNELAANFGLRVDNVVVPEVLLSPDVQAGLDEIVRKRLQTEQANQDLLRVKAEAEAEQERQQGEIRIAQSRIQEEARQQTLLAQLDEDKILAQRAVIEAERANELARVEAERAVIEAQKSNDLLAAERDLEIQTALAEAAVQKAKADVAVDLALAELYQEHPEYLQLQSVIANASALQSTDKIIFTPEGTVPTLVVPGPGIVPTVDTGAPAAP